MNMPVNQYKSAIEFSQGVDISNIPQKEDQERIKAIKFFEDAYHNRPEAFQIAIRSDDDQMRPIFLPSARKLVDSTARFLAVKFGFAIDPSNGTAEQRAQARMQIGNLFKRERMYSKFNSQRRYGLIRGDMLWHITADTSKAEGTRISIHELDPSTYFPITDPNRDDRVIGCHIVNVVDDPDDDGDKKVAQRQTYRMVLDDNGNPTGRVTSEVGLYEIGKWDDRTGKSDDVELRRTTMAVTELPEQISQIPVYHIKNNVIPGADFGMSELSGIERLLAALNQSITDEDLTLVMQGLGMYTTDAAPPQTAEGADAPWEIGPGVVVEVGEGNNFSRVTGVSSVAPYIEHMNYLDSYAQIAAGVPDIAAGRVDVSVAESGISLQLQMSPIISKNQEKEQEILSVMDHMLYDLMRMWYPAYENIDFGEAIATTIVGDPLPVNREARLQEIMLLFTSGLITMKMAQAELASFGYNFTENSEQQAIADQAALALAKSGDPFANRFAMDTRVDPEPDIMDTSPEKLATGGDEGSGSEFTPGI